METNFTAPSLWGFKWGLFDNLNKNLFESFE
jgi:hypothetical protein